MRLLILIHEEGQEFDCFRFRRRGVLQGGELKESLRIRCKLPIIVYNAGSALGNHFRRVCENCPHFVPNFLSQFAGLLYSLCVRKRPDVYMSSGLLVNLRLRIVDDGDKP